VKRCSRQLILKVKKRVSFIDNNNITFFIVPFAAQTVICTATEALLQRLIKCRLIVMRFGVAFEC